jgi:uncharacterized repeat protein (TIGR03806 family)
MRFSFFCLAVCLSLPACGGDDDGDDTPAHSAVTPAPAGDPWETLDEWHLFDDAPEQKPNLRVEAYDVISPLWSDGALKYRFLYLPEGAVIGYEDEARWQLPVGTILVKTFAFPIDERDPALGARLIETRLLVHETDAWVPHTYLWNDAQTEAERKPTGATVAVSFIDSSGAEKQQDYGVPNTNQCHDCHGAGGALDTLGGRTRQLDREHEYPNGTENQIDHLAALGWLGSAPPAQRDKLVDPAGTAPLAERARSYLDANCGHCHTAGGGAAQSGALFAWTDTAEGADPKTYGVCKVPTSAGGATCGLNHDVVPGAPEESVMICRMSSRESKVQMPPLATRVVDDAGVALMSEWIASLTLPACP